MLIVSQSWLFVCHRSRFTKAGDYHTFSIAGKPFFVVLGSDSQLRAFHNVCRHRAYTVVRRAQGSSLRFSCKYHGWQYDSLGKLVKAPQFENTVGFNMQNNSLYEVALRIDEDGFIFVNFANGATSPPVWTSSLKNDGGALYWESFEIKINLNWRIAGMNIRFSKMFISDALQHSTSRNAMGKRRRRRWAFRAGSCHSEAMPEIDPWVHWRCCNT
jgi:phenylpropionate dioxygenase-like ring-hydroxylating dioxygenase large terminal subunit